MSSIYFDYISCIILVIAASLVVIVVLIVVVLVASHIHDGHTQGKIFVALIGVLVKCCIDIS
jgi:hypothetical protein